MGCDCGSGGWHQEMMFLLNAKENSTFEYSTAEKSAVVEKSIFKDKVGYILLD